MLISQFLLEVCTVVAQNGKLYSDKATGVCLLADRILAIGKDDVDKESIPDDSDDSSEEDEEEGSGSVKETDGHVGENVSRNSSDEEGQDKGGSSNEASNEDDDGHLMKMLKEMLTETVLMRKDNTKADQQ